MSEQLRHPSTTTKGQTSGPMSFQQLPKPLEPPRVGFGVQRASDQSVSSLCCLAMHPDMHPDIAPQSQYQLPSMHWMSLHLLPSQLTRECPERKCQEACVSTTRLKSSTSLSQGSSECNSLPSRRSPRLGSRVSAQRSKPSSPTRTRSAKRLMGLNLEYQVGGRSKAAGSPNQTTSSEMVTQSITSFDCC